MPTPGQVRAGESARLARAQLGISQADLATRAGVDPGTLSALETGRRWPRSQQLAKISRALDQPPSWLEDAASGTAAPSPQEHAEGDGPPNPEPGALMKWVAVQAVESGYSVREFGDFSETSGLGRWTAERTADKSGAFPLPEPKVLARIGKFLAIPAADVLTRSGLLPESPSLRPVRSQAAQEA